MLLLLHKHKQEGKRRGKEERKERERKGGRDGERQERRHTTSDHTVFRTHTDGCDILDLPVGVLLKTHHNIYSMSLYSSALKGSEGNMHSPIKVNI